MIREFREVIVDMKKVMQNLQNFSTLLQDKRIQIFLEDLPALTLRVEETLSETKKVLNGVEKHWLLKKYIPPENSTQAKKNEDALE